MKKDNIDFMKKVMSNDVLEAKRIFEKAVSEKVNVKVSELRQKVAREFFNKK